MANSYIAAARLACGAIHARFKFDHVTLWRTPDCSPLLRQLAQGFDVPCQIEPDNRTLIMQSMTDANNCSDYPDCPKLQLQKSCRKREIVQLEHDDQPLRN